MEEGRKRRREVRRACANVRIDVPEVGESVASDAEEPTMTESDVPFSQELEDQGRIAEREDSDEGSSDAELFDLSTEEREMLDEEILGLAGEISGPAVSDPSPLDITAAEDCAGCAFLEASDDEDYLPGWEDLREVGTEGDAGEWLHEELGEGQVTLEIDDVDQIDLEKSFTSRAILLRVVQSISWKF